MYSLDVPWHAENMPLRQGSVQASHMHLLHAALTRQAGCQNQGKSAHRCSIFAEMYAALTASIA